jgi:hypothetical protein
MRYFLEFDVCYITRTYLEKGLLLGFGDMARTGAVDPFASGVSLLDKLVTSIK